MEEASTQVGKYNNILENKGSNGKGHHPGLPKKMVVPKG